MTEGETGKLTVTRSGADKLGEGSVRVTSSPLTATSPSDYKPVAARIAFAAGETQKTASVQALAAAPRRGAPKSSR